MNWSIRVGTITCAVLSLAASQPHAPTWQVIQGSCKIDGDCVTTPNYPGYYGNDELCVMTTSASHISATSFLTEEGYDKLHVKGYTFDGDNPPRHVAVGDSAEVIIWTSDSAEGDKGWKICKDEKGTLPFPCSRGFVRTCESYEVRMTSENCQGACIHWWTCCKQTTTNPPTTSPQTCASFYCPYLWVKKPGGRFQYCVPPCTKSQCCFVATTTPPATTTPQTCASFFCPDPWRQKRGFQYCSPRCTKSQCCFVDTTTPSPPTNETTTPSPLRKYDTMQEALMQQANKKTSNSQAWGTIALFATGGFAVASTIHVYRRLHNTRRVAVTSAEDGMMPSESENLVQ